MGNFISTIMSWSSIQYGGIQKHTKKEPQYDISQFEISHLRINKDDEYEEYVVFGIPSNNITHSPEMKIR